MKTLNLILLSLAVSFTALGQGPYFGVKYTHSTTWLINKQVSDSKYETQEYVTSFGNDYGLIAGYKFSETIGLELNLLLNNHIQKYYGNKGYNYGLDKTYEYIYESETRLKTFDIPVLLKAGKVAYFEIGPIFSFLTKATYNRDVDKANIFVQQELKDDVEDYGVTAFFKTPVIIGGVIGFGADIEITDVIFLNLGLRIVGYFSDLKGVNALGETKYDIEANEIGWKLIGEENKYGSEDFVTSCYKGGIYIGVVYRFE